VIYAFSASISGKVEYESNQIVLLPKAINFKVYNLIVNDKGFWISYINTLFYTVFGTSWSMFISITGAYVLTKKRLLFRKQFNLFVVFTMWFNAGIIPMYLNYVNMNVNNRWGIIVAFGVQAFNIILLRNYFSAIPESIEEAAKVDGVNEFQLLAQIFLPMSKAALATVTLFYATSRWNGYFWARILLTDPKELPLQVYMRILVENYQSMIDDMGDFLPYAADSYIYAILVCSIIPVLIIYPYIQKYFAKGVNMGGVKG
jgi:putative aldouronate transport system permease protein